MKLGRRESLAIARLSVAVLLDVDESGKISKASIAPGACLPMPGRITPAEEALTGKTPLMKKQSIWPLRKWAQR